MFYYKKTFFLLGMLVVTQNYAFAGIQGSKHDFSGESWNPGGNEICFVCHTPHNSIKTPMGMTPPFLWNHYFQMPYKSYQLYSSPTLEGGRWNPEQPTQGPSKLCLSCHDGTIAVDSVGADISRLPPKPKRSGTHKITGPANLTMNLTDDHPIHMIYDTALSQEDPGLKDPATAPSGLGGTIQEDMLHYPFPDVSAKRVECNSCHDPHNSAGLPKMLIKDNTGSDLCLTCHNK